MSTTSHLSSIGPDFGSPSGGGCPPKFETVLSDIIFAGNLEHIHTLKVGDQLDLAVAPDGLGVACVHLGLTVGYLPPDWFTIVECIRQGRKYSAQIAKISGPPNNPDVRLMVVGV